MNIFPVPYQKLIELSIDSSRVRRRCDAPGCIRYKAHSNRTEMVTHQLHGFVCDNNVFVIDANDYWGTVSIRWLQYLSTIRMKNVKWKNVHIERNVYVIDSWIRVGGYFFRGSVIEKNIHLCKCLMYWEDSIRCCK